MAEERQRLFGGALPLDDVDSGDIDLAGRVAEFVDRLRAALDDLTGTRTVDGWAEHLGPTRRLADGDHVARRLAAVPSWPRLLEEIVAEACVNESVSPVELSC